MKFTILSVGGKVIGKSPTIFSLSFSTFFVVFLILVLLLPNSLYSQESKKSPSEDLNKLLELGDTFWKKRGTRLDLDNAKAVEFYRAAAAADPFSYEAHWKCARALWWQSDQLLDVSNTITSVKKEEQEKLGRLGMEIATRAKLINPDGIEGHLFFALTAFHYAFGVGVIDAMKGGVFDFIYEDLTWCYKNDKDFDKNFGGGMVRRGLSAYFRIVPWPNRDKNKALDFATGAVRADDTNVRNMICLAAAYEMMGMSEAAIGVLEIAVEMEGDKEREPDFRRWKKFGKRCIKEGRVIDTEMLF